MAKRTMTLRRIVAEDAEAIRAIYNHAVRTTTATMDTEPRTEAEQAVWMAAHEGDPYPAWVAVSPEGVVVGYVSLSPYNRKPGYRTSAEVSLYVHEAVRGQGIGTALLQHVITEAPSFGFVTLISLITGDNIASRKLHEKYAFETVGTLRQVARKFDRWVDVVLLQKTLSPRDGTIAP
jgi:phosphinothricin acetyltransferase